LIKLYVWLLQLCEFDMQGFLSDNRLNSERLNVINGSIQCCIRRIKPERRREHRQVLY